MRKNDVVVFGLTGAVKDRGPHRDRWSTWRPSVSVCQHEDLLIRRFELLVEPDARATAEQVAADIALVSPETQVRITPVDLGDPWDFESVYGALHELVRAYDFRPEEEDYLVHITTGTHVVQICLFLLTESRRIPGRLLQTSPPDRDSAPHGRYSIIDLDLSRFDQIATRFESEKRDAVTLLKSGIATRNADFNRDVEEIERVAVASRAPILLMGPTGAGKSQLAKRIFELKKTRHLLKGDFVEVNCATIRGDAAMSALFGHKKGAFTGALADRQGLLRAAGGGVLFLDEIGELGADEQAMLLRALEEKRFLPVGSDREVESDFQLIAGTNRDLVRAAADGRFRDDLLARINLWTFYLPGLRERLEDLEPNIDYELEQFARSNGRRVGFNREALARYLAFATGPDARWTGNFRDLNASVTRMATLAPAGRITEDVVRAEIDRLRRQWPGASGPETAAAHGGDMLEELLGVERSAELDRFDRVQLSDVVAVCRASSTVSEAGRALFAASRGRKKNPNDADRLRKYLARFGLAWKDVGMR
jgi:transcriptional regulatory protein RtcR